MGTTEGWTYTTFVVSIYYRKKRKSQIQFVTALKFDDLHIEHVEINSVGILFRLRPASPELSCR